MFIQKTQALIQLKSKLIHEIQLICTKHNVNIIYQIKSTKKWEDS